MNGKDLAHDLGQGETLVLLGAQRGRAPREEKGDNRGEAKPAETMRRIFHPVQGNRGRMKAG
jgi:hypothetical protein